ncbi:hypothetical protein CC80DRAFT_53266 [Byssothecium circinans]|uniref:Uncharacterized protein n=1 Tax=Byssothecium circinans TaxID=147558 RepID=A0A6A5U1W9_9PLEO|nr:hypothetical protein CC80DRAFT_53266 [Byssothecium circinans]
MHFSTIFTTLALAATSLAAPVSEHSVAPVKRSAPKFTVKNYCKEAVYVTSVASARRPTARVKPFVFWSEEQYYDPTTGGISMQVTKGSSLDGIHPILNAAYTYNAGSSVYYSLSTVNDWGYDFAGTAVKYFAVNDFDNAIVWKGNVGTFETHAYLGGETELVLELCVMD